MDPEQLTALTVAAASVLAALGLRQRRDRGQASTAGVALGRAGAGAARVAGNITGTTGRAAAGTAAGTAAAGVRVGGAAMAHTAGLAVDGVVGLGAGVSRAGRSMARGVARQRS
jgi:hypothetical protein